ncbi:hypothetical protein WK78_29040 [Burkholderia cepacia]|uniref:hypothetical protein n=1 Tax=Burkholderia cepacia TaxID=292 RepID=UPI00075CB270|nr:hypothetical protein [Burkholderia cepacia]KVV20332.1 hypothetical protein WK78_29040 [Burkholderia cepacia]
MKITDDMLTEEQRSAVEIALSLIGLSSDPRVQKAYKGLRSLLTGRRTTPDREAIRDAAFEQCAQLVDRMAKQKHDRGADDALVRSIAARIRALKTAPTSDKGGA